MPLDVGDSVRVRSSGALGELLQIRVASSAYVVKLKDGTLLKNVPFSDVEKYSAAATPAKQAIVLAPDAFAVGTKVDAKYKGKAYYPGAVAKAHGDGTYDIDYDDGEVEKKVHRDLINVREAPTVAKTKATAKESSLLTVGTKVDAKYKGKTYYPGTIARAHADDRYDIDYDDGEKETKVPRDYLRIARYKGKSKYYPGKITKCHSDGSYDIDYDDGEVESRVEKDLIRVKDAGSDDDDVGSSKRLTVGTKVEAKYKGKTFYPGKIAKAHADGSYDIDYDDGEIEKKVSPDFVRVKDSGKAPIASDDLDVGTKVEAKYKGKTFYPGKIARCHADGTFDGGSPKKLSTSGWVVGATVEAKYKGKSKFYPGTIAKVHTDDSFDIDYDDGEKEKRVEKDLIRLVAPPETAVHANGTYDIDYDDGEVETRVDKAMIRAADVSSVLKVGQTVQAKYKGKAKFYPGKITKVHGDGSSYDIDYDDGEVETRVRADWIQPLPGAKVEDTDLEVGTTVEAKYKGKTYYPGKITRCHADGTFDVDYDDGEKEKRVDRDLIRVKASSSSPKKPIGLKVGARIEARYKGKSKYYPGKITKCHSDGSYDIDYDDGEVESRVEKDLIRVKDAGSDDDDVGSSKRLAVGTKVEAKYKGKTFYPGTIAKAHADGSYDINYDDGEIEKKVPPELVRIKGGSKAESPKKAIFRVGAKVEARYKGKAKYYPGTITRCHSDETFDIDYDDGEVERRVEKDLVRPVSASGSDNGAQLEVGTKKDLIRVIPTKKTNKALKVGAKVEAKYKGKSKFYPGKITKVHGDGSSYDISYDDGETETRVESDMIRAMVDGSDDDDDGDSKRLAVGTKVEAKYKGKTYYPGTITKVHLNGSYDVDYDDGEIEKKVDRSLIRVRASFAVGADVDVRVHGKYVRGRIQKVHSDGCCDVSLANGDVAKRVDAATVRAHTSDNPSSGNDSDKPNLKSFPVGSRVEAKPPGKKTFSPGRVTKVHASSETLDVTFDDGRTEARLALNRVRKCVRHKGDAVQLQLKGKSVRGTIAKVHSNGSYDVALASGDTRRDPADVVDAPVASSSSSSSEDEATAITKGTSVLLRNGRKGVVSKLHASDRSVDVTLIDGSVETRVPRKALSVAPAAPSSSGEDEKVPPVGPRHRFKYKRGQPVESQWKRKTKLWMRATIVAKQVDGTYTIRYQDGVVADNAPEATLRSVLASSSDEDKPPPPALSPMDERFYLQQLLLTLYEEGELLRKAPKSKSKTRRATTAEAKDEAKTDTPASDNDGSASDDAATDQKTTPRTTTDENKHGADSDADEKTPRTTSTDDVGSGDDSDASVTLDPTVDTATGLITEKELRCLFGSAYITKLRARFDQLDKHSTGVLSLRQAEMAITSLRKLHYPGRVAVHLNRFPPLNFIGFVTALAYVSYCDAKGALATHMELEAIHATRFASKHEKKRQVQLWQTKLGFRVFERLTHAFQEQAVVTAGVPMVTVDAATAIVGSVGRHLVPKKPIALYWAQLHLLPHHLLDLSETCCVFYQQYGSLDAVAETQRIDAAMELRPVAFVAACMYSNGDDCHMDEVVRRLSVGRLPAQVDMIHRVHDAFLALCDERQQLAIGRVETLLQSLSVPADVVASSLLLFRHHASVSLVELFALLGHSLVDSLDAIPSISNALSRLRLRESHADVKQVLSVCRTLLYNVVRFPNNRDYWRIRCDTPAFEQKLGRFRDTPALLEAIHFVLVNQTHYELRGARSPTGARVSALSASTLALLKEALDGIEHELVQLEGGSSVRDVVEASLRQFHHSVPEVRAALDLALIYLLNILKHPKDAKYWRIRATNKVFASKIGCLQNAVAFMQVLGFDCIEASAGCIYELRQDVAKTKESDATPLAHFSFPTLSERVESFLWRRKQDIEFLLHEGSATVAKTPLLAPEASSTSQPAASTSGHREHFPYGLNTRTLFGKSDVQSIQIDMIDAVFQSLDASHRGYLTLLDVQHWMTPLPFVGSVVTPEQLFSFLDLDTDGHVTKDEFVASFGPLIDHPYTLFPSRIERGLSVCESVSASVGVVRMTLSIPSARCLLADVLRAVDAVLAAPTDPRQHRTVLPPNAPLRTFSDACKELLHILGLELVTVTTPSAARTPAPATQPETASEHAKSVRDAKATAAAETKTIHYLVLSCTKGGRQPATPPAIGRLQTMRAVLFGHFWGMAHPSVSDVGGTTRGFLHHQLKHATHALPAWIGVAKALRDLLTNMVANAHDPSFRRITVSSPGFMRTVGSVPGGLEWFVAMGYHESARGALEYVVDGASSAGWVADVRGRLLEVDIMIAYLEHAADTSAASTEPATTTAVDDAVARIKDPAAKKLVQSYQKQAQFAQVQKDRVQQQNAQLLAQVQKLSKPNGRFSKATPPIAKTSAPAVRTSTPTPTSAPRPRTTTSDVRRLPSQARKRPTTASPADPFVP
ncbi:hypothetical protein SPRG_22324 [Saprolegnia parasitica CBS 223.65]|uniref:EF-hand domain-containing protein n=1 Tax=Saprolegnia parasitica (strain CBS 223.65) TaxID=695850 RepID=A0A067BTL2_SAPPC|nr:hypothetical protein SPRG_22324 [Saprolegnia parasitica CBS 223.65]KDO21598.1 hypothetical protein SPRG_22324 [Saprolegnia parasitica CBS 223.65]|eukprot:XP_012207709.1 hypothetical protein SPRG_22324 [Saprolegnia parasitica CBS 223.65]